MSCCRQHCCVMMPVDAHTPEYCMDAARLGEGGKSTFPPFIWAKKKSVHLILQRFWEWFRYYWPQLIYAIQIFLLQSLPPLVPSMIVPNPKSYKWSKWKTFTNKKPDATPYFCKRNFSLMYHIDLIHTLLSVHSLLLCLICTTYVQPGFETEGWALTQSMDKINMVHMRKISLAEI